MNPQETESGPKRHAKRSQQRAIHDDHGTPGGKRRRRSGGGGGMDGRLDGPITADAHHLLPAHLEGAVEVVGAALGGAGRGGGEAVVAAAAPAGDGGGRVTVDQDPLARGRGLVAGAAAADVVDGRGVPLLGQLALELLVEAEDGALARRVHVPCAAAPGREGLALRRRRAQRDACRRT